MTDKLARAEKAIEANPFDLEAWGQIVREAQTRKIDDARPYFERLVSQFPTSGRYWKLYIEQEMRARNYDKVEKVLFVLMECEACVFLTNYIAFCATFEALSTLPHQSAKH